MAWRNHSKQGSFEEIDLTLSSPEPQPQMRPRLPHSNNMPVKKEPTISREAMDPDRVRPRHTTATYSALLDETQTPNLEDVARLVDISDKQAIKDVLMHLCTLSPALSRAVVRGLTPGENGGLLQPLNGGRLASVKREPNRSPLQPLNSGRLGSVKREGFRSHEGDNLLQPWNSRRLPTVKRESNPSPLLQPMNSRPLPTVKRERNLSPAASDCSSSTTMSDSLFVGPGSRSTYSGTHRKRSNPSLTPSGNATATPSSFSALREYSALPNSPSRLPSRKPTAGPSTLGGNNPLLQRTSHPSAIGRSTASAAVDTRKGLELTSNTRPTVKVHMKKCLNCDELFDDETKDSCFYHPGQKRIVTDITGVRRAEYTCCHGDIHDPPCESGEHVAATASAFDTLKRPRPSDGPSPSFHKSPRVR